jgi:hypothetical protein
MDVVNPPAWAIAWLVTSVVISGNVEDRWTNFGAGGALVFAVMTGCVLMLLFARASREAPAG